jgi:hypothetical protein
MWAVTLQELSLTLPKATYNNLFAQCQFISREGDAYTIGFPNESALEWVQARQLDNINRTLRAMSQNSQAYIVPQLLDTATAVPNGQHVWKQVIEQADMQSPGFSKKARLTFVACDGDAYRVSVPSQAAAADVEFRYSALLNGILRSLAKNPEAHIVLVLEDQPEAPEPPPPPTDPSPSAPEYDTAVTNNGSHGANGLPPTPPPSYTEEEWQIVHQVVSDHKHRQEGKRKPGRPHSLTTGNGSVRIQAAERDPMYSFCATPHYASRFWRPFLGMAAFSLWEILRSYYELDVRYLNGSMPTISQLAVTLGANREVLMGRPERTVKRRGGVDTIPASTGAIEILAKWGILTHVIEGEGTTRTHALLDLELKLPLLAPTQVATLDPLLQQAHSEFITRYGVTAESWLQEVAAAHVHRKAGVTK